MKDTPWRKNDEEEEEEDKRRRRGGGEGRRRRSRSGLGTMGRENRQRNMKIK